MTTPLRYIVQSGDPLSEITKWINQALILTLIQIKQACPWLALESAKTYFQKQGITIKGYIRWNH